MRKVSNVKDRIKITTREEGIREKKKNLCVGNREKHLMNAAVSISRTVTQGHGVTF